MKKRINVLYKKKSKHKIQNRLVPKEKIEIQQKLCKHDKKSYNKKLDKE